MRCLLVAVALAASSACAHVPAVEARLETSPVGFRGDAADDPAIWVAPQPSQSRVIGTQKKGGYFVYDLDGRVVQEIALGRPNNVDLVDAFAWAQGAAPLVVASDRADNTIALFRLDPQTGRLEDAPRARIASGFAEVYGVCIGRRANETYIVATSIAGDVAVWRLSVTLQAQRLGAFSLGSIAEGCAVDGSQGYFYVAEEMRGLWKVPLTSGAGEGRALVDAVGGGRLYADVEGVAIWEGEGSDGYLVVSVQGRSRFAVYDRGAPHSWRGSFTISEGDAADAVSETDGVAITSAPLNAFPRGLLVAQDDRNTSPAETQNFKYVSWADVAVALKLE